MNDLVNLVPRPATIQCRVPLRMTLARSCVKLYTLRPEVLPVHVVELRVVADEDLDRAVVERLPIVRGRLVFVDEHGARTRLP